MLITILICIQWKSSRFLFPVSTVPGVPSGTPGPTTVVLCTKYEEKKIKTACRLCVSLITKSRLIILFNLLVSKELVLIKIYKPNTWLIKIKCFSLSFDNTRGMGTCYPTLKLCSITKLTQSPKRVRNTIKVLLSPSSILNPSIILLPPPPPPQSQETGDFIIGPFFP